MKTKSRLLRFRDELTKAVLAETAPDTAHHCHLCGAKVGEEARSDRNPKLFLCSGCRKKWRKP